MMRRALPLLFIVLWATGFIGAKMGAPYAEPFTFLTIRFAIALAVLVPLCIATGAKWPALSKVHHAVVVGALIHGIYLGGVFWAIDRGMPAGVAALIVSIQPILTALLAAPVLGEKISARHWIGLVVGLAGVVLVLSPGLVAIDGAITIGMVSATAGSIVCITVATIYQKRFCSDFNLWTGASLQYIGALAVVGSAAMVWETGHVEWHAEFVFALLWLVLVLSIGAVSLLMLLLKSGTVSRIAALFYIVPVVVAVMAWALFGETLTLVQLLGMAAIALAIFMVGSLQQAQKTPSVPDASRAPAD